MTGNKWVTGLPEVEAVLQFCTLRRDLYVWSLAKMLQGVTKGSVELKLTNRVTYGKKCQI